MSEMVTVVWSATLLPSWADCVDNGESAVNDIAEDWFADRDFWEEHVGIVNDSVSLWLIVHEPESIAGEYHVDLDRVIKARARKHDPSP
jgi:hypothetical protein